MPSDPPKELGDAFGGDPSSTQVYRDFAYANPSIETHLRNPQEYTSHGPEAQS